MNDTDMNFEEFANGSRSKEVSPVVHGSGALPNLAGREKPGVRSNEIGRQEHPDSQGDLQADVWADSTQDSNPPQVRQPTLLQSPSSGTRNAEAEYPRCDREGKIQDQNNGAHSLHEGSRISAEGAGQVEKEKLQSLPQDQSKKLPATLQANPKGLLVGSSFEDQYRLARAYHASGLMPKALSSPEKVLVAMQLCHELQLPPMSSMGKIMVINQTPAIFGDLPLALVHRSGKLTSHKEEFEDKDGQPYAVTCTVQRDNMEPIVRRFTIDDAKKAGLFRNDIWNKYPKRMLQCRARSWALKDAFPDVLSGISVAEYDHNVSEHQEIEVSSTISGAAKLNEMVKQAKEPVVLLAEKEINGTESDEA